LLGDLARVERIVALNNCTTGVITGRWAHVSDTQSSGNRAGHGIAVGESSIIVRSIAAGNNFFGILGNGPGVLITDSTAAFNIDTGIHAVEGGMVARSTSRQNGTAVNLKHGIDAPLIVESVATQNRGRSMSGHVLGTSLGDGNMSGELVVCIAQIIDNTPPQVSCPTHPDAP
jgi:hypothetical protein